MQKYFKLMHDFFSKLDCEKQVTELFCDHRQARGPSPVFFNSAVRLIGRRVYLFQQGIIIEDRGKLQVFPWSQIAEVSQSITPRGSKNGQRFTPSHKYTLRRLDGYQITLDDSTKNIAFLGPIIANAVAQVSRALHAIRAGQTLWFAQFSINQQGLGNGREFSPWSQVQSVTEDQGLVTINQAGKLLNWGSATPVTTPNYSVFFAVAQEMIRQARGR